MAIVPYGGGWNVWGLGVAIDASGEGRKAGSKDALREVRFAFYGCVGASDPEGPEVSEAWQREMAGNTIAGRGVVVTSFFDVRVTSRVPWSDRPRASALLAASDGRDRGFDAVVVGDYEQAFGTVAEFEGVVRLFGERGVQVWLPQAGGLIPVDSPDFSALLTVLQSVVHSSAARRGGRGRRCSGGQGGGGARSLRMS